MNGTGEGLLSVAYGCVDVLVTMDKQTLGRLEVEHAAHPKVTRARTAVTSDQAPSPLSDPRHDDVAGGLERPTDWGKAAAQRVSVLARLPVNWDGCDGLPPSPAGLETVGLLLERLEDTVVDLPVPIVCPVSDGSIQFEWSLGAKHVEFRVGRANSILCLRGEEGDGGVEVDVDELEPNEFGIATIRKRLLWLIAK